MNARLARLLLANCLPVLPTAGLPVGAPVVLGNTHATLAKGQDGRVYFAGNTGAGWQVTRLQSPYPLASESANVTFAVDPGCHRAGFTDSTGAEVRGVRPP